MGTKGYDCVLIPGALKSDATSPIATAIGATMFCGQSKGLGSKKSGDASKTVCCKSVCTFIQQNSFYQFYEIILFIFKILAKTEPFRIQFVSDGIESLNEGKADGVTESSGFQLAYIMSADSC